MMVILLGFIRYCWNMVQELLVLVEYNTGVLVKRVLANDFV